MFKIYYLLVKLNHCVKHNSLKINPIVRHHFRIEKPIYSLLEFQVCQYLENKC